MRRSRNTIDAYQAKTHWRKLLERVEAGEEIVITRHGSAVAKLVPEKKETTTEERAAAIARIERLGASLCLGGLKVKDLIAEGRRNPINLNAWVCGRMKNAHGSEI
jgi:prevent-host-death family protein